VQAPEIAAFSRLYDPSTGLHLALLQWQGTAWAHKRDGWIFFDRATRISFGLSDKLVHHRAARRLEKAGVLEVRVTLGERLEYRLLPHWASRKAKVINLAAARRVKRRWQ
jgi:hypothetical protein